MITKSVMLEDISLNITDGTHSTVKDDANGSCYLLSCKNIKNGEINIGKSERRISSDQLKLLKKRTKLGKHDVLLTTVGTIGELAMVEDDASCYDFQRSVGIIKPNPNLVNPVFLYYSLKNELPQIFSLVKGAVQQCLFLGDIKTIRIDLPDLSMQNKIVSVLQLLDKRIRNNVQINENLSDQIQAIYSNEFDPSTHTPSGTLADICKFSSDRVPVSELSLSTYYSTENMQPNKMGSVDATSLPSIALTTGCHKGDVLISNIRAYFKKIVYVTDDNCGCSTDVLCFVPKEDQYSAFLFGTLYMDRFFDYMVAGSKGTKMPRGDKQQIMNYPVVMPDKESLGFFNELIVPMLDQIAANRIESSRLKALRDTLLPKLISGELDVSDMDF